MWGFIVGIIIPSSNQNPVMNVRLHNNVKVYLAQPLIMKTAPISLDSFNLSQM